MDNEIWIIDQQKKESDLRKSQVGSGDRSEKIRTYNYPQGRVTDHRIGLTLHALDKIIQGDLDPIIVELISVYRRLNEFEKRLELNSAQKSFQKI